MSHNCDMILFNFYRNWLIHKVLVSDFEGSNPSLTAKYNPLNFNGFFHF